MFHFSPKIVNSRDSLDQTPVITAEIPEGHPLHAVATELARDLFLASLDWDWPEPAGDCFKKRIPGSAWE
ncbi:MAG TPA: hypothetical protein VGL38_05915 [bacterium]|jgi:hypothetical protein